MSYLIDLNTATLLCISSKHIDDDKIIVYRVDDQLYLNNRKKYIEDIIFLIKITKLMKCNFIVTNNKNKHYFGKEKSFGAHIVNEPPEKQHHEETFYIDIGIIDLITDDNELKKIMIEVKKYFKNLYIKNDENNLNKYKINKIMSLCENYYDYFVCDESLDN